MKVFVRQAGTLFTGTVLAQIVNLLAYPFLTRTYSAADFGEFSLFLATSSIVGTVACLRFDVVVQAAPFAQRSAVHRLGIFFCAAIAVLSALVQWVLFPSGHNSGGLLVAALLGISVFFTGYTLSAQALLVKHERYRRSAGAQLIRTIMTALPQVLLFWLLPNALGLMIGYCLGAMVQAAFQARWLSDFGGRPLSLRRARALLVRYRVYPLFDLPGALLATASLYAGNYFIFDLFGAANAGLFAVAFRLAALPLALVASNLSEVYYQKASRAYLEGTSMWRWMRVNLRLSLLMAILMVLGIVFLSRPVITLYLGREWEAVADVMIALSPMMALRLVSVSVGATSLVLRRPQWSLLANAALLGALVLAAAAGHFVQLGFFDFLWLTSLSSAAIYAAYILFLMKAVRSDAPQANRARSSSGRG